MRKVKLDMHKLLKEPYAPPAVLQAVGVRLEQCMLNSVVDDVKPVETAGQKVDGEYTGSDPNTFNFDWNENV